MTSNDIIFDVISIQLQVLTFSIAIWVDFSYLFDNFDLQYPVTEVYRKIVFFTPYVIKSDVIGQIMIIWEFFFGKMFIGGLVISVPISVNIAWLIQKL